MKFRDRFNGYNAPKSLINNVNSVSRMVQFPPSNGSSFSNNNKNYIRIELNSSDFANLKESFLQFTVSNRSGVDMYFDGSAQSLINRLRVSSGSSVIFDSGQFYNVYQNIRAGVKPPKNS